MATVPKLTVRLDTAVRRRLKKWALEREESLEVLVARIFDAALRDHETKVPQPAAPIRPQLPVPTQGCAYDKDGNPVIP